MICMGLRGNAKKGTAAECEVQYIKLTILKPLKSVLFPQMKAIAMSEWCPYFSADILPKCCCREGFNFTLSPYLWEPLQFRFHDVPAKRKTRKGFIVSLNCLLL